MVERLWPAREGDEGEDIAFVQLVLQIPASGIFDARTSQRVKGFQKANGLYPNGALTKETLALLLERTEP
jgi:peptidoglycan hydrolase-like protein with peptidoglycan-binding domain